MVGGGGDAPPPPPPPPINGGEYLLHILKNPPRYPHPHPHQPSQTLPHDPAVAAVGPSIPFPSNGSDFLPPLYPPHNFYTQGLDLGLGLGFPPNPNPNPNLNPNWPFDLIQNRPINNLGMLNDLAKLINPNQHQHQHQHHQHQHTHHHQQQEQQNKLVFGTLNSGQLKGNLDYDLVNIENRLLKERGVVRNASEYKVNHGSMEAVRRQPPPPGFSSKSTSVGKGNSEMKVERVQGNFRNVVSPNGGFVERERSHLDPGPSSGRNLDLFPGKDVDVEKSLMAMHEVEGRSNGVDKSELDDLEECVDSLVLEDEVGERNDSKKNRKSRDKDYRADKRGQWLLNQRVRNYKRQTECRGDINRFNAHFLAIYESLIPAEEEKERQRQLLALLDRHVTKEWPGARLYLYGSCANSFGFRKSDIDVCLAMEGVDVNKSEILLKLADILKSDNLENVQALTRARVPIVKLMDPVTGISCDICVNNLLAVVNTKLLRDYSKIDERLRQLAFIVKHWAKSRGVNETYQGTLSSYAYVLMCIHFLQRRAPSILPCLQGMERTYTVTVDDVECSYFDQVEKLHGFGSRNGESIAQLVWAFFNYWAYYHDYANNVISIRTGSLVSKRGKGWTRRIGNDRHLICIEDPFEVSHDLGRVVDKRSIRVLREEFERAAEIMQYDPNPFVKLFEPYVPS